jgi:hypothetical protein
MKGSSTYALKTRVICGAGNPSSTASRTPELPSLATRRPSDGIHLGPAVGKDGNGNDRLFHGQETCRETGVAECWFAWT